MEKDPNQINLLESLKMGLNLNPTTKELTTNQHKNSAKKTRPTNISSSKAKISPKNTNNKIKVNKISSENIEITNFDQFKKYSEYKQFKEYKKFKEFKEFKKFQKFQKLKST